MFLLSHLGAPIVVNSRGMWAVKYSSSIFRQFVSWGLVLFIVILPLFISIIGTVLDGYSKGSTILFPRISQWVMKG